KEENSARKFFHRMRSLVQLPLHILVADNRSRDEMRKLRDVTGERVQGFKLQLELRPKTVWHAATAFERAPDPYTRGFGAAKIDVQVVADRFERIKGDPRGQKNNQNIHLLFPEQGE